MSIIGIPRGHRRSRFASRNASRAQCSGLFALAIIVGGCGSDHRAKADHVVTAGANDSVWPESITLEVDESFEVRLPSQAGSGYAWRLEQSLGDGVVAWSSRIVERARSNDRRGENYPTSDVFTFHAVRPGEATIQFAYDRAVDRGVEPAQRYQLAVNVVPEE